MVLVTYIHKFLIDDYVDNKRYKNVTTHMKKKKKQYKSSIRKLLPYTVSGDYLFSTTEYFSVIFHSFPEGFCVRLRQVSMS